ncbi:MAG: TetR/AcrR family transcriptional regulator [Ancrocorticia sp.]|uniref:TetR/AcrR family transcriptional regulator n=1 Tax=Ancrocorticia sp. TaxID=2593684 RepID=UPI003F920979
MGSKTGPKPRFTSDDAVDAALVLGAGSFTMGQVARDLGVTTPALYRVVSNREDLFRLCIERIFKGFPLPDPELSWADQLREFSEQAWKMCENHPELPLAIINNPNVHSEMAPYFIAIEKAVERSNPPFGPETIMFALDFIADTVFMTHIGIAPMREVGPDGRTGLARMQDAYHLSAGAPLFGARDLRWMERGYLDRKIDFIIEGLEHGLGEGTVTDIAG